MSRPSMVPMMRSSSSDNSLFLVSLLQEHKVPPHVLEKRYPALTKLLRGQLNQVPSAAGYLEVWPPAFQSRNLVLVGFMPIHRVEKHFRQTLLMCGHASIRVQEQPYVVAHNTLACCQWGATRDELAAICEFVQASRAGNAPTTAKPDIFDEHRWLAIKATVQLSTSPPTLESGHKQNLIAQLGASKAEWIAACSFFMSYLGKFADAIAVEIEQHVAEIANACIGKTGWTPGKHGWDLQTMDTTAAVQIPKLPGLFTRLSLLPLAPFVGSYLEGLMRGIPATWSKLEPVLKARVGHSFPFLAKLVNSRLRRAIAATVVLNFNPSTSVCGLFVKSLLFMSYATYVGSECLTQAARDMAAHIGTSNTDLDKAAAFATNDQVVCDCFENKQVRGMMTLGKALLPTPCNVTGRVVDHIRELDIAPSVIVELTMWVGLLHMLFRTSFYTML